MPAAPLKDIRKINVFSNSCILIAAELLKIYTLKMIVRYIWILGKEKASKNLIFQGFLILLIV